MKTALVEKRQEWGSYFMDIAHIIKSRTIVRINQSMTLSKLCIFDMSDKANFPFALPKELILTKFHKRNPRIINEAIELVLKYE